MLHVLKIQSSFYLCVKFVKECSKCLRFQTHLKSGEKNSDSSPSSSDKQKKIIIIIFLGYKFMKIWSSQMSVLQFSNSYFLRTVCTLGYTLY